jgi:hypothetical protein
VFNVEGTVVSNTTGITFVGLGETTAGFTLVNADGYTPYLDTVLDDIYPTDATVHPYILHFDDYTAGNYDASNPMGFESVTDPLPSGNLVMAMGCDYDYQDYVFSIDGAFDLIYAVGCTYAVSSGSKNERFTPEYRVPQHNKKAASEVSVEIIANNLAEGDIASTADVEIHVVDINHGVAVGENLDEMFADSSVGGITIEVPGVETGPIIVDISSPTGTGHDPSDPLVYAGTITNTAGAIEGAYPGLIKVLDAYAPGLNTSPLLNNMDGIQRVNPIDNPLQGLFEIIEFATYQTFSIDVATGNLPPVVGDLIPHFECPELCVGELFSVEVTEAYDPEGQDVTITWDFDGNLDFADDMDGDDTNLFGSYVYSVPGDYEAWCRVSDDTFYTDGGPLLISAMPCIPDEPVVLNTVPGGSKARKMAYNPEGGYVYLAQDNNIVVIVDVDPVEDAYEVNRLTSGSWVYQAAIGYYDGYVYCSGCWQGGVVTIDVDPPEDAYVVNTCSSPGPVEDLEVVGDRLYVAGYYSSGGLEVFDLADPSNPNYIGHVSAGNGIVTSVTATPDNQWGFFVDGYHDNEDYYPFLRVVDLSNPYSPNIVGAVQLQTNKVLPTQLDIQSDYVYIVYHPWNSNDLMSVVDVSNKTNPVKVCDINVGSNTWDVKVDGNYAYVCRGVVFGGPGYLRALDISTPSAPFLVSEVSIPGACTNAAIHCGMAYTASWENLTNIVELY